MSNEFLFFFGLPVTAYVVAGILTQPGEILSAYGDFLSRLPEWAGKPLGLCAKCFAGQISFWYFPFSGIDYSIISHIVAVSFVITFAHILTKLLNE